MMRKLNRWCLPIILLLTLSISSCKKKDKPTTQKEVPTMTEECMDGYAFVYIKGKVDPRMISTAYQKYGVMILNIVDEDKNTAVYSYDKKKISGDSILQILHYSQFANKARCLNKSESNYLLRP